MASCLSDHNCKSCLCREKSMATAALCDASLRLFFSFLFCLLVRKPIIIGGLVLKEKVSFQNFLGRWFGGGGGVVAASSAKGIALLECEVTRMCVSVYLKLVCVYLLSAAAS